MSTAIARVPIWLVEFGEEISTHQFQVPVHAQKMGGKYDNMIIGLDVMIEIGLDIMTRGVHESQIRPILGIASINVLVYNNIKNIYGANFFSENMEIACSYNCSL